ncbi:MAG: hypothetical protein ACYTDT_00205 [Planctomycetota bacterium]
MAKKIKRPGRVKVNRRKSAKTEKPSGAVSVAAEMLPKLPADAARELVWEVAKSQVQEFLHQHGLADLEEQINACREELKLHRLEVQQRTEALQVGETTTARWQVAPGVACKIRDQLSKYEARKQKLEKDSREYFAAVMAWYGLTPDGQKLPKPANDPHKTG